MREFLDLLHMAHDNPELERQLPKYEDCLKNHELIDERIKAMYMHRY